LGPPKIFAETQDFHSLDYLEVPVGGRPGSHQLSAGGGEQAVNIAPQLTRLKPATVLFLLPISDLGCTTKFSSIGEDKRVLQLRQLVYKKKIQILALHSML
jgi:hypothetical protein